MIRIRPLRKFICRVLFLFSLDSRILMMEEAETKKDAPEKTPEVLPPTRKRKRVVVVETPEEPEREKVKKVVEDTEKEKGRRTNAGSLLKPSRFSSSVDKESKAETPTVSGSSTRKSNKEVSWIFYKCRACMSVLASSLSLFAFSLQLKKVETPLVKAVLVKKTETPTAKNLQLKKTETTLVKDSQAKKAETPLAKDLQAKKAETPLVKDLASEILASLIDDGGSGRRSSRRIMQKTVAELAGMLCYSVKLGPRILCVLTKLCLNSRYCSNFLGRMSCKIIIEYSSFLEQTVWKGELTVLS